MRKFFFISPGLINTIKTELLLFIGRPRSYLSGEQQQQQQQQ